MSAVEMLSMDTVPAGRYLIIGGGAVGLETAEYLAQFDTTVSVIEMADHLGDGLHATRLNGMLERLNQNGVDISTNTLIKAVKVDLVQVDTTAGSAWIGPFDYLVFAVGSRSNQTLAQEMDGEVPATVIGDALQPRSIYEAISEGLDAALKL